MSRQTLMLEADFIWENGIDYSQMEARMELVAPLSNRVAQRRYWRGVYMLAGISASGLRHFSGRHRFLSSTLLDPR
jgi:hypothetical protein